MVFKAIGQIPVPDPLRDGSADILELRDGRIAVNDSRATSLSGVWAGGDCIAGPDLTVQAVQDGKIAAQAIDRRLRMVA
jgi:glutamate synthase (NADPH/NADH) small chain